MPDPQQQTETRNLDIDRAVCVLYKFASGAVGSLAEMPSWLAKLSDYERGRFEAVTREILAAASLPTGGGDDDLEAFGKRLMALRNGPGPDRDERYQHAWRQGVDDAYDALAEFAATPPDDEPAAPSTGDGERGLHEAAGFESSLFREVRDAPSQGGA